MTGNVVLLGFAAAGAPGHSLARSGAALIAFVAGTVIGGRAVLQWGTGPRQRLTVAACGIEAVLLAAAMAVSLSARTGSEIDAARVYAVIGLTGIAMGVRNATVRKLGVPDLTTTVLTLAITGLGADSSLAGATNANWARRLAAVVALLAGAAGGAFLLRSSLSLALAVAAALSGFCGAAAHLGGREVVAPLGARLT